MTADSPSVALLRKAIASGPVVRLHGRGAPWQFIRRRFTAATAQILIANGEAIVIGDRLYPATADARGVGLPNNFGEGEI